MIEVNAANEMFFAETDSKQIQKAVDYACENGYGRVVIPKINLRTGKGIWNIEEAVLLPDDMTVVIEDAHLRLADGIMDNIFRNKNAHTDLGRTLEGEQHRINILGQGNAVLDGGKYNGVCEQMHRDEPGKHKWLSYNLLVFLDNVSDFRIEGLNILNSRYWSVCVMYCRFGRIADLHFRLLNTAENQDGVDLRIGCEYITVENLTGLTGDDTLALTALPEDGYIPEKYLKVEGKSFDIHDITVRNIISASHGCGIMRLLCEDTACIYNVTADGIKDTGETISGTPVIIGSSNTGFARIRPHVMGEFRNIVIRNVTTCAQYAVEVNEPVQDVVIENVSTFGNTTLVGIKFGKNFQCDNLSIRNVTVRSEALNTCVWMRSMEGDPVIKDLHIEKVTMGSADYVFRGAEIPIQNFRYENPKKQYFTEEKVKLPSPYGRYHLKAFGKVIENRPEGAESKNFLSN